MNQHIRYIWGFPFQLSFEYQGCSHSITTPEEAHSTLTSLHLLPQGGAPPALHIPPDPTQLPVNSGAFGRRRLVVRDPTLRPLRAPVLYCMYWPTYYNIQLFTILSGMTATLTGSFGHPAVLFPVNCSCGSPVCLLGVSVFFGVFFPPLCSSPLGPLLGGTLPLFYQRVNMWRLVTQPRAYVVSSTFRIPSELSRGAAPFMDTTYSMDSGPPGPQTPRQFLLPRLAGLPPSAFGPPSFGLWA